MTDLPARSESHTPRNLILDTHTFLWYALTPERVPDHAKALISSPLNRKRISIVSFWEMGIKAAIGNLPEARNIVALHSVCEAQGIEVAPISIFAVDYISRMPFPAVSGREHKDPFDRMIAATALTEGLVVLSADAVFDVYGVTREWN